MIIPSIDLMDGNAVQLIGGKERELDAGDPRPILERFRLAGEVAVIDLDAALGRGSNAGVIRELCAMAPCRVGGGIRDVETAISWLDAGARKVILGTAARPDILRELPPERVIVALDAVDGEVVVEGWQSKTGRSILDRMAELEGLCAGYLVTFVEREGRLGGTNHELAGDVVAAAKPARVTIAGGVTTADDIAQLDRIGADAQVGMALYKGLLRLADAILAPVSSDRQDGLFPTVVCDERGVALGLAYSNRESVRKAVETRRGVYHSRKRGLWEKGASSEAFQELLRIDLDCDRDTLRFVVRQHGEGFCHLNTWTCWGDDIGLGSLARRLAARHEAAPEGSYTARLLSDPRLLEAKLLEEARELATADGSAEVTWEAADLLYFALVAMARAGVPLDAVEQELDRRSRKVSRRAGDAKPPSDE
jgi:phosphoribosyl-AMP cyclohydrolase / phosphoribosyl-ATP pyrophosphohydrolase